MPAENLLEIIASLTPEQQESVRQFVDFLRERPSAGSFLTAAEEFMEQHPDLLRRSAQ